MASGFRELQAADAPEIFEILRPIYTQPQYPLGGAWNLRLLEIELDNGKGIGLVENGKLAAFVLFRVLPAALDVVILGTHPDRQRQGLMGRLLRHWMSIKPADKEIWLEVHEGNLGAQNLYKKLGFRQVGRREKYYRDGAAAVLYNFR